MEIPAELCIGLEQTAKYLGVNTWRVGKWIKEGVFPTPAYVKELPFPQKLKLLRGWRKEDLDEFQKKVGEGDDLIEKATIEYYRLKRKTRYKRGDFLHRRLYRRRYKDGTPVPEKEGGYRKRKLAEFY
jgi:hypothetical protein